MENNKKTVYLLSAIGFLIFCYVAVRAAVLSFTGDEGSSFLEFVRADSWIPEKGSDMEANNHLLNTWLMRMMSALFGNSEFSLRLPNVLSYLLYAYYSAQIALSFKKFFFAVYVFLLLNLNLFLLDFFSLARGYGMSMGLMIGSLYYLFCFIHFKNRILFALLSVFFASMSVLANLTLLNYLLALLIIIFVILFFHSISAKISTKQITLFFRDIFLILVLPLVLFYFILPWCFKLRQAGAFYYGGHNNFLDDTISATIEVFLYETHNFYLILVLRIFVLLVVFFSAFFVFRDFIKRDKYADFFLFAIFFLIVFCSLSTIIQHWIFSTLYLTERTALLFIPLFTLLLVFLIKQISHTQIRFTWILPVFTLLLGIHFFNGMNFYSVQQWPQDADVKKVLAFLQKNKIHLPDEQNNIYMGVSFNYEPCINYYRATRHLDWLNVARTTRMLPTHNYYLLSDTSDDVLEKKFAEKIAVFPEGTAFYRNLKKPLSQQILFHEKIDFENKNRQYTYRTDKTAFNSTHCGKTDTSDIFSDGFEYSFSDSLSGTTVLATMKAMAMVSEKFFKAVLVFQLDSAGKVVFWQNTDVRDNIQKHGQWYPVTFTAQMPNPIKQGQVLKVYLWNIGRRDVFIDDMELKIIGYKF